VANISKKKKQHTNGGKESDRRAPLGGFEKRSSIEGCGKMDKTQGMRIAEVELKE